MTTPGGSSGYYEDIEAAVETAQQRVAKWEAYAQRADANTAALITQWRQRYPNMGPQTILPAAMSGVLPTTQVAQSLAVAETKRQSRSWAGRLVGGIGDVVGEVKDTVADVGKGALRGTFGVLNTGGQSIQSTFRDNYDDGSISAWDVVSSPFEATGRFVGSFAGMDDSTEIGQLAKQVRGSFQRGTPLQGIDTGDGFFLRGKNETERVKASRSTRQINGRAASIGRWVANNVDVVEPGSTGYNIISGFVDASVAIAGDPSTFLTGPVSRGIQASRSLTGAAPKAFDRAAALSTPQRAALADREVALSRAAQEPVGTQGALGRAARDDVAVAAGLVDAHRRTVIPDKALWWLTQDKDGMAAVQAVAQTNDAGKVRDLLGGKVPAELLDPLTKASTPEEVIAALGPAIGSTRQLSAKFKVKRRTAPDSVWRRVGNMNAMTVSTNNIDDAVTNIDNMLRTAGIRDERRGLILLQAARSTDEAELQQAVFAANNAIAETVIHSQVMGTALGRKLRPRAPLQTVGERGVTEAGRLARYNGLSPNGKVMVTYGDGTTDEVDTIFQVDPTISNRVTQGLTRAYADELEKMRAYDTTATGEPIDVSRSLLSGSLIPVGKTGALPSPASLSHLTQGRIPLLNARDIRRSLAPYPNLLANPLIDVPVTAMRFITGQVFKPLVLLRGAYTVRVTMDAHARMAFAGDDGLFNHPIRAIQWMRHKRGDIDDIDEFGNVTRMSETQKAGLERLKIDPDVIRDEMTYEVRIMEQGQRKFSDGPAPAMRDRVNAYWDKDALDPPENFVRGFGEELRRLHTDAVIRQVARAKVGEHVKGLRPGFVNGRFADEEAYRRVAGQDIRDHTGGLVREGIEGTKDWLFEGTGKTFRKQLARGSKKFRDLGTGRNGDPVGMRQASDQFIDLQDNILRDFTLNDPVMDLIVATGKIGDEPLMGKDGALNPKALSALADHLRENPGRRSVSTLKRGLPPTQDSGKFAATLNGAVESLFDWFAAKPDDWWSRNPVFKQRRLNELAKQVTVADPQTQRKIVSILRANGADKRLVKQAEQAQASGRVGTLTYDEVNLVAKARAFDQAKDLLYDVSTRSNWGDSLAILVPFADAFADSVRTYTKLVKDNPLTLGRPSLAYQGARDYDPDGDGKGFFYKDEFGKEVFAFPMSGRFTELLTGVPVGLDAPVQNLNIATTSVIPGFGPAVALAASAVLPDDPEYDWLRNTIIPYGEKDFSSGALESFFPAWLTKWTTSQWGPFSAAGRTGAQDRAYAASVRDTMEYLASTPEYSLEGLTDNERIDAQTELVEEARSRAKVLWLVRGMAQFWAPSPPSFDFVQADKDGKLITQVELARVYREMENDTEAGGYRTAAQRFLARYGEQAFLTTVSNTEGKEGFSPAAPTKANDEFLRRHPEVADKYPLAFGLFLDTDGEFDPKAYRRQQDSGQRVPLSPEEALLRVNRRLGGVAYEAEKTRLEEQGYDLDDDEVRDYLRVVRGDIARMHPGWTAQADPTKTPKLIQEVVLAANDPVLGETDAGQALRAYLGARDQVLTQAQTAGVDWTKAKTARAARRWLRDYAGQLSEVSPQFGVLFDRSLMSELRADDEEAA